MKTLFIASALAISSVFASTSAHANNTTMANLPTITVTAPKENIVTLPTVVVRASEQNQQLMVNTVTFPTMVVTPETQPQAIPTLATVHVRPSPEQQRELAQKNSWAVANMLKAPVSEWSYSLFQPIQQIEHWVAPYIPTLPTVIVRPTIEQAQQWATATISSY